MECPKCGSTDVTSAIGRPGVWQCMTPKCNTVFDRDAQAKRLGIK